MQYPDVSQITIDGEPIKNGDAMIKMEDYLVYSPEFMFHVPEATYGTSLAAFFDRPFKHEGSRPAVAAGCFFLVKLNPGNHFIHTFAKGPIEEHGVYRTEKLYQIEVVGSQQEAIGLIPQSITSDLVTRIKEKCTNEEIDEPTYKELENYVNRSRHILKLRLLVQAGMQKATLDENAESNTSNEKATGYYYSR